MAALVLNMEIVSPEGRVARLFMASKVHVGFCFYCPTLFFLATLCPLQFRLKSGVSHHSLIILSSEAQQKCFHSLGKAWSKKLENGVKYLRMIE